MIDLMIKNVFQNSNRIDAITKCIDKINKRNFIGIFMISVCVYSIAAAVDKQEQRINKLESEIEEMKSKGE